MCLRQGTGFPQVNTMQQVGLLCIVYFEPQGVLQHGKGGLLLQLVSMLCSGLLLSIVHCCRCLSRWSWSLTVILSPCTLLVGLTAPWLCSGMWKRTPTNTTAHHVLTVMSPPGQNKTLPLPVACISMWLRQTVAYLYGISHNVLQWDIFTVYYLQLHRSFLGCASKRKPQL